MKKSKFIEIIKKLIERERKLKEVSTSSATPGYMTPNAFSGKGKMDRRNSIASGSGYKKVNEAKFAVSIDLGLKGEPAQVIVDAGSKGAAITMVAKRLRGGRNDIKGVSKVNPGLGKRIDSVDEDITSSGYSQLRKPVQGIAVALKDLLKGLQRQNDDVVIPEIEYIYEKAEELMKILQNKKYNESLKEGSYEEKQIMNQLKGGDLTLQIKSSKGKTNFLKLTPEAAKKIAKIMKTNIPESVNEQIPRYFRGYVSNVNDNTDRLEKNVKQMIVDLGKDGLKKESLQLASLFKKHIIEFKVKFQNMAKQLAK
jgi:hypothetical protein